LKAASRRKGLVAIARILNFSTPATSQVLEVSGKEGKRTIRSEKTGGRDSKNTTKREGYEKREKEREEHLIGPCIRGDEE